MAGVARLVVVAGVVVAAASVPDTGGSAARADAVATGAAAVRHVQIIYRAHNGARRAATVVVPRALRRGNHAPVPLVISPHGRGLTGRQNSRVWANLPGRGGFVVVSPDGQGRALPRHSWGYAGQIRDLARMPSIVRRALPWLRIDRSRVYAVGGSMGGQEALLLLARYPRMLAGVAVFDPVTDFAQQYRSLSRLSCNSLCRRRNSGPLGRKLQSLARLEVGGSLATARSAFSLRSPMRYARRIAFNCVPLQIWWSVYDRTIRDERRQAGGFFRRLREANPDAPVTGFRGRWIHTVAMRAHLRLPLALARFDLLPWVAPPYALQILEPSMDASDCTPR